MYYLQNVRHHVEVDAFRFATASDIEITKRQAISVAYFEYQKAVTLQP
jgi:hypothetical protein